MYKELVVNVTDLETRIALVENGTIVEVFIDRGDDSNITGNIYKGKVQRVLPGMQAAFINIGINQAAFIHVNDVLKYNYNDLLHEFDDNSEDYNNDDLDNIYNNEKEIPEYRIEDVLTEGQEIVVQVAKSPISTKGARVTCHISLPGRFVVLMPTVDHIGVSRRIENEEERIRLKDLITSVRKEKNGYICRTAAEGVTKEQVIKEMEMLNNLWNSIQKKSDNVSSSYLLHRDLTLTLRAIRDLLTHEADRLIIDSKKGYESVKNFIEKIMPDSNVTIELYNNEEPIFEYKNIEGDIARALKKKVWLKSGGYIIIEQTEALTSIDVNTGRFVGKHNFEETILKTNLEAVKEIAYQIRLRNMGGIIVIDFIDMKKISNQEKIYNSFIEVLKKDKSKTNVLPMSELGLIQMTRKRVRKSLTRMLCDSCSICSGHGYLLSKKSICLNIYREVLRQSRDMKGGRFTIRVNPQIAEYLHYVETKILTSLEEIIGTQIQIYPNTYFHIEEFDVFESIK